MSDGLLHDSNARGNAGKLPVTIGARLLQYRRGYTDALLANAFGHSDERKAYQTGRTGDAWDAGQAYKAGWADGRAERHADTYDGREAAYNRARRTLYSSMHRANED